MLWVRFRSSSRTLPEAPGVWMLRALRCWAARCSSMACSWARVGWAGGSGLGGASRAASSLARASASACSCSMAEGWGRVPGVWMRRLRRPPCTAVCCWARRRACSYCCWSNTLRWLSAPPVFSFRGSLMVFPPSWPAGRSALQAGRCHCWARAPSCAHRSS